MGRIRKRKASYGLDKWSFMGVIMAAVLMASREEDE